MSKHYKYGGSTAKRTMNCPAWVNVSEGVPKGPDSSAAMLGTSLHWLVEQSLLDEDFDPADFIGKSVEGVDIELDHVIQKVYPAVDAFDELVDTYELEEFIPESIYQISDQIGGTADFIGWSAKQNVVVCADYKSGDGIIVDAEGNDQLLFYTFIALANLTTKQLGFEINKDTKLVMAVVQPSERKDELLDIWEVDDGMATLEDWAKEFKQAVVRAEDGDRSVNPGSWCRFCPAEAVCPAKTGLAAKALRLPADSENLEALNEAMLLVKEVEEWAAAVRKLAHEQAEQGVKINGFKLVNKRATRKWNDEKSMETKFKKMRSLKLEDYTEMKLMSPAKLEKVCKAKGIDFKKFTGYISSVSTGTTLAPDSDKRQEVIPVTALKQLADRVA